jgi:uncharacterized protein DUF3187
MRRVGYLGGVGCVATEGWNRPIEHRRGHPKRYVLSFSCCLVVALTALCAACVRAQDQPPAEPQQAESTAAAEPWYGFGPLQVRNFQPIQLIFLNLPFTRARVLAPRAFTLRVQTAESNEIATDQGRIQALLKFETNRTVVGGSIGIGYDSELSFDIPFISRYGGFLDPVINGVEKIFGSTNPERHLFPDNTFGGFTVLRGDVVLFNGTEQYLELGDVWFESKTEVLKRENWPLVSLRGAIKVPTGRSSNVYGSGKPDFGLGVAADYQALDWLMLYANLDGIYPVGPITDGNLTSDPFLTQGLAFELRLFCDWASFLFQQEMYTSAFHGTGSSVLEGTVVELAAGLNLAWGPVLFQVGGINNVSGVAQAADFTLMAQITYTGRVDLGL